MKLFFLNIRTGIVALLLIGRIAYSAEHATSTEHSFGDELSEHPVGYSLIGMGGLVSFIAFGGLFAGGDARSCKDEKNRLSSETEEQCKDRKKGENAKFARTMGITLGAGLATLGIGIVLVKFDSNSNEKSASLQLKIENIESPALAFNWVF